MSDYVRFMVGVDLDYGGSPIPWQGKGEVIALFDSGIDRTHVDLENRIKKAMAVEGACADDAWGHGTHVAGILAGTGHASGGKVRGVAPEAELVSIGIVAAVDGQQKLLLPVDLGALMKRAVEKDNGAATIINLSWGRTVIGSAYEQGSYFLDRFAYDHPEVLIVIAAGNSGTIDAKTKSNGFKTVLAPATAKNVLTVGAAASHRAFGSGFKIPTYRQLWPALFSQCPGSPLGDLEVVGSGKVAQVAVISSRGPTDYESVKPDVVAPGTYILSTRARRGRGYWRDCKLYDGKYAYDGGTSMAAPAVAGAAAVLRQYVRSELGHDRPSAALLKALLVASAEEVDAPQEPSIKKAVGSPDFDQGFGLINLARILPVGDRKRRRILFADVRNDDGGALESRVDGKTTRAYSFEVLSRAKDPLRIVLAWTDLPGRGVQNNLQFYLRGPGGQKGVGNLNLAYLRDPLAPRLSPDSLPYDLRNNLQSFRLDNPPAGKYYLTVQAINTLDRAQGFALAVCGELRSRPNSRL